MASSDLIAPYASVHADPEGPGDARPTALQIIQDEHLINAWADKTILITGGSSGLGVETARALHATGARIFITSRDMVKAEAVREGILSTSPSKSAFEILHMELDSLDSVRAAAAEFLSKSNRLNVLINNAGIMATPESKTKNGFESHFGVNHLAHFLLTQLLLPTLIASSTPSFASRIINVSSRGHFAHNPGGLSADPDIWTDLNFSRTPYNPWLAYGRSKTANILHALHLEKLYSSNPEHPVHAFSLHPGGITTSLWRHLDNGSPEERYKKTWKSPEQGAATTVWCATAKVWEGKRGRYCEDCQESPLAQVGDTPETRGVAPWGLDEKAAETLWRVSEEMVGPA